MKKINETWKTTKKKKITPGEKTWENRHVLQINKVAKDFCSKGTQNINRETKERKKAARGNEKNSNVKSDTWKEWATDMITKEENIQK